MVRNIFLATLIFVLGSCGKDIVIVEDPIPPNETDELFEVNIVGFATDEERAYIPNGSLFIDGHEITSDESGFFHYEKSLIGKRGKVVKLEKEGFLPNFYRIINNKSLEDVVLNLQMIMEPTNESIGNTGGTINNDQAKLTIEKGVLNENTDIVFKSLIGKQASIGNLDPLYLSNQTNYLLKEASIYIKGNSPISQGADMNIQLNSGEFLTNEISDLSVFHFDESTMLWKEVNTGLEEIGDKISFSIQEYGWWTVAKKVPSQYSTLNFVQPGDIKIIEAETKLSIGEEGYNSVTHYTSATGSISTYLPLDVTIYADLNNGQIEEDISTVLTSGVSEANFDFNEDVQFSFEGNVYSCDFTLSDGFVAVISEGQHKIKEINSGLFTSEAFENGGDVSFQFYSKDFEYLSGKMVTEESLKSENNNFLSCQDLNDNLIVIDETSLIQDFDMCRIKLNPKETIVIGEKTNGDIFLVSYPGEKEGSYDGLIYYPLITDEEVKTGVKVNIIHYDEVENKVAGFIKTEYISSGEELTISFIGDIE